MSDTSDDRSRPAPRPRPAAARPSPSPRPRVAGSRRDREEAAATTAGKPTVPGPKPATAKAATPRAGTAKPRATARPAPGKTTGTASTGAATVPARRRSPLVPVLALLCVLALAAGGWLLWQRMEPRYVDSSIFAATEAGVQALYAYDYQDSEGSVQRKLDVLTGPLREQYEADLSQGGIIETYQQVSATTSYEVLDVGLQQINQAQDTATLVVFGQYVVKTVNSGEQPAPEGSECQVTPDGAQSCTQTVQVSVVQVDGEWKIDELTLLTTS